jgi:hypothetical protein
MVPQAARTALSALIKKGGGAYRLRTGTTRLNSRA